MVYPGKILRGLDKGEGKKRREELISKKTVYLQRGRHFFMNEELARRRKVRGGE